MLSNQCPRWALVTFSLTQKGHSPWHDYGIFPSPSPSESLKTIVSNCNSCVLPLSGLQVSWFGNLCAWHNQPICPLYCFQW